MPVAPLNEQKRIADKLEKLFARVDTCLARLERVQLILEQFRQAVLVAATSGDLTVDWREEKKISKPWEKVSLSDVAETRLGKMLDKRRNQGELTPYLRNANVRWFGFDLIDIQEIRVSEEEKQDLYIRNGDILICEGGEPGRCAVWYGSDNMYVFQKALHRARVKENLLPEWLCYCLKTAADSGNLRELFTGTTIQHLTGVALAQFEFEIPSLVEQQEIVRRVEAMLARADHLMNYCLDVRNRVEQLTPILLDEAFRGELVPQNPNDEPALILLEKIRTARASMPLETQKPRWRPKMQSKSSTEPIGITEALRQAQHELSSYDLFTAAGYPAEAESEEIETFFVALRDALRNGQIAKVRRGDVDWFSLIGKEDINHED